ncbi:recombinase family protein [Flavobacterium sp. CLA17]|uniref:recombinase family protein n=1 Tax=Flavobacterium sp. CLA17 TaxID=2724135 RepID=UPI0014925A2B|nr:recombinase family protein [Flavobacterium sp. CLA17]QSB27839.1 recombinase family protein [Flavobacterium sp. CLA17]
MKSAYLYVRVSTDEQKRKGYSLPEQEDRLLRYCEQNQIAVRGIFREDFSAKDFNRPEWKKIINTLKKHKKSPPDSILFIKWDRFSRNIEYAYQMLGILRGLNTKAMAIDQPIDFDVPESIVMLAVYLSIPEAENSRRGRNTSDGMRRSRKMGRWPGKAPMGYSNQSTQEGRKIIVPKFPEADLIRWAFEQFAKGTFSIRQVRTMTCQKGLQCSNNNFWKILRNPIYCGIITVRATKDEEIQFIKAIHEPIISEDLFRKVEILLTSRRKQKEAKFCRKLLFPLRGFTDCPFCGCRFTGSISQGKLLKYRYYHCSTSRCKGRYRADILEALYESQLKRITLSPSVYELFSLVLEDENIFSARRQCLDEKKAVLTEISQFEELISKARRHLLAEKIDFEDFRSIKKEYNENIHNLNGRLQHLLQKLNGYDSSNKSVWSDSGINIFQCYNALDFVGKRHIASLFSPSSINIQRRDFNPLQIDRAIKKIVICNAIDSDVKQANSQVYAKE